MPGQEPLSPGAGQEATPGLMLAAGKGGGWEDRTGRNLGLSEHSCRTPGWATCGASSQGRCGPGAVAGTSQGPRVCLGVSDSHAELWSGGAGKGCPRAEEEPGGRSPREGQRVGGGSSAWKPGRRPRAVPGHTGGSGWAPSPGPGQGGLGRTGWRGDWSLRLHPTACPGGLRQRQRQRTPSPPPPPPSGRRLWGPHCFRASSSWRRC